MPKCKAEDKFILTYKIKYKFGQFRHYERIARKILNYALDVKYEFEISKLRAYYKFNCLRIDLRICSLLVQGYTNLEIKKILKHPVSNYHLELGRLFLKNLPFRTYREKLQQEFEITNDNALIAWKCFGVLKHEQSDTRPYLRDYFTPATAKSLGKFRDTFYKNYWKRRYVNNTREVKHLSENMPSRMVNDILRKYITCKTKSVKNIKLKINANVSELKYNGNHLQIKCKEINISVPWHCPRQYKSINSVEISKDCIFVSVEHNVKKERDSIHSMGVDRNTKSNLCSIAIRKDEGNVIKLLQPNIDHLKRQRWKIQDKNRSQGDTNNKEMNIFKNIDHQVSRQLVKLAVEHQACIVLEDLTNIRQIKGCGSFRRYLNTWSFYRLEQFIKYKAKMYGIQVINVNPAYTSQDCSMCSKRNKTSTKKYKCKFCLHHAHRDINASFNIADRVA